MGYFHIHKLSLPETIFGRGSVKYLGVCARRLGARKVFLVTDPGLEATGWVDLVLEILERDGLEWVYFSDVVANPRDFQIERGAELYREAGADVVVALGGGSPMDAAKGIAVLAGNGGRIHDYEGANRIHRPLPPMLFAPSTAGSGSDISQFAIVTDVARQVKMSIVSRTLVPNVAIIDPLVLSTKSDELIVAAAIDALAHAIESYVSVIAFPLTEAHSLQAIRLIMENLRPAVEERSLDVLDRLAIASTSAAIAFSNASLGMVHALAHSLGGMLDVVHGLVHPVLLPPVMRYNLPASPEKMATVGEILLGGRRRTSPEATALAGIERLEEFCRSFGIPTRLREVVSDYSLLPRVCQTAQHDSCLLTNPRPADWEDMLATCEEAW
jgi:alcohol dehydrogenase